MGSGGSGIASGPSSIDSGPSPIGSGPGGISTLRATAFAANGGVIPDANMRRTDLDALHPIMRSATSRLLQLLQAEQLPFRLFEAFRGPARQAWLYAQGRTLPGSIVTNSQPWDSYHQYGLAADFVLWLNNQWSWSIDGAYQFYWKRLRDIGTTCGLEPLEFEAPHLQVMNLQIANLRNGIFPDGDDEWRDNLEATIVGWTGQPAAPTISSSRPPL